MSDQGSAPATPDATSVAAPAPPIEAPAAEATPIAADAAVATPPEPPAEKSSVPEQYDLKTAEGINVDPWTDTFKELGLSNEQAQKLVDHQATLMEQQQQAAGTMLDEAIAESRTQWRELSKSDKDIGGAKFEASQHAVKTALAKVGDAELTELLDASGLGDHPAMMRLLVKVGQSMQEDRAVRPNGGATHPGTFAQALYGKSQ